MPHSRRAPRHNEKRAPAVTSVTGRDPFIGISVREGGVEPPRPCGHWNLNPARLPIPPPAHWVRPPAPSPVSLGLAPSDIENTSTWDRVGSHPLSPGSAHLTHTYRAVGGHVSTSYRSGPSVQETDRVHSQVRDTGRGPPLRSCAEEARILDRRSARRSSKGGRSGNRLIAGRVDTISEQ